MGLAAPTGAGARGTASQPGARDSERREEKAPPTGPDAVVELARLLAGRLVGHALAVSDDALRHWARTLLDEARGARRIHLLAPSEMVERLHGLAEELTEEGREISVAGDPELARGSLRVETELGTLDASVDQALERLVRALRTEAK